MTRMYSGHSSADSPCWGKNGYPDSYKLESWGWGQGSRGSCSVRATEPGEDSQPPREHTPLDWVGRVGCRPPWAAVFLNI